MTSFAPHITARKTAGADRSTLRSIQRIALLQDYAGRPEELVNDLEEIAAKGYHGVDTWVTVASVDAFHAFCERAHALGLSTGAATCYMIGQFKHIAQHPEQRLVQADPGVDTDGLGTNTWGCPFNPDFKARYLTMLRRVAVAPGAVRVWVNDEASLATGCYCPLCLEEYRSAFGGAMPRIDKHDASNWKDERWRLFLKWRIDRWVAVHAELADAIHAVNPNMCVGFQTSPGVDLWCNPWHSAVDLHAMSRVLDAVSVDPYHTFHRPAGFVPGEVYQSEWSRFLAGITAPGKRTQIVVQGFSHPDFTRPLNEADGVWTALVPVACGVDMVMPYSYSLQRCSPVQQAYERCFKLDPWFARARPLKYAAIVHGLQTEVYAHPLPRDTMGSYDGTRLFPVAEALRQHGVPYGYLADAMLDDAGALTDYQVVVLPDIACLSVAQSRGIESYLNNGGNLVVLGDLGSHDETGNPVKQTLLEKLVGIRAAVTPRRDRLVSPHDPEAPLSPQFPWIDEQALTYWDGTYVPVRCLGKSIDADVPSDARVLARFDDNHAPAIASVQRGSARILWLAGVPARTAVTPALGSEALNLAHRWLAELVEWTAGAKPPLRVEGWPPDVPMRRLRPVDRRHIGTFEFFPLVSDSFHLALVTSYFREPTRFRIALDSPQRGVGRVTELLQNKEVVVQRDGAVASIVVEMGFDDPARCFLFE